LSAGKIAHPPDAIRLFGMVLEAFVLSCLTRKKRKQ
jgi:hypothetical protein